MPTPRSTLRWLLPLFVVGATAMASFWLLYAADRAGLSAARGDGRGPLEIYSDFDPSSVNDPTGALAGTNVAVFGIVITVVSIIVQLSAGRYAGVTRRFVRDRVNLGILAFYVIVCVFAIWVSMAIGHGFVPHLTLLTLMVATSLGLSLMAPYFGYVFWFLEPRNIIARIRRGAEIAATRGARQAQPAAAQRAQVEAVASVEELTDIVSSSISNKDKVIETSRCAICERRARQRRPGSRSGRVSRKTPTWSPWTPNR
jgi:uncharacterized membrane protein